MDYARIYRELIADRLANPPSPYEYAEYHHIQPRSLGGTDDDDNLLLLRPEDHFFAHLLLAKIHDTIGQWSAVMMMHERTMRKIRGAAVRKGVRSTVLLRRSRQAYGWTRRAFARHCSESRRGAVNGNYKSDLITLKRADGSLTTATRLEWAEVHKVQHAALIGLLKGRVRSHYGWMLPNMDPGRTGKYPKGANNSRSDMTVYRWVHLDGRTETSTKWDLAEQHNIRVNDLTAVINGAHGNAKGWYLADREKLFTKIGTFTKMGKDEAVHTFVRADGTQQSGTRKELEAALGMNQRDVSALINGDRPSAYGWMLPETARSGYTPRVNESADHNVYEFQHQDGRTDRGTVAELMSRHGGQRNNWLKVIKGGTPYKGWRMAGTEIPRGRGLRKSLTFRHRDGRVFEGTQIEFTRFANLSPASACMIAAGECRAGWSADA